MAIQVFKCSSLFEVRFVDEEGGCERPHTHTTLIVSAVVNGEIKFQINKRNICLRNNMVMAIGANVLHCVEAYSQDFTGVYVLEIIGFPTDFNGPDSNQIQSFGEYLTNNEERYKSFINLCKVLLSPIENTVKIKLYLEWAHELFIVRFDYISSQALVSHEDTRVASQIRKILDEHVEENAPYAEIAKVVALSKEHCNRVFKKVYKLSIQAYFLNKKVERAKNMFCTNLSLSEIALLCGFYDQSHFNRVFKEIYQISPAKYRKALLG